MKKGWVSYLDIGKIFSLQRHAPRGCLQLSVMMRLSYYLSIFFFPICCCLCLNSTPLVTVTAILLSVDTYKSLCRLPVHSQ